MEEEREGMEGERRRDGRREKKGWKEREEVTKGKR
jgi:hypothetical protein